jgi:hypothetical protein
MAVRERPTAVTVVAVILLVLNGFGVLGTLAGSAVPQVREAWEKAGISVGLAVGLILVTCGIVVVAAIGMLAGKNWGRLLYLVGTPVMWIIGWITMGFNAMAVPGIIVYIVFLILLTRPAVNAYFSGAAPQVPPPPVANVPEPPQDMPGT